MSHGRNYRFLKRIRGRDLIRRKNIRIRRTSNRMRSFTAMRHRHNLEDTHELGLYVRLGEEVYYKDYI